MCVRAWRVCMWGVVCVCVCVCAGEGGCTGKYSHPTYGYAMENADPHLNLMKTVELENGGGGGRAVREGGAGPPERDAVSLARKPPPFVVAAVAEPLRMTGTE